MDIIVTHKSSTIACTIVVVLLVLVILWSLWSVLNWVWLRPKKLERCLRKQGLKGNSYRLLFGDMKESSKMVKEAQSSPISISDDILPRVIPSIHKTLLSHGKSSFIWFGPTPNVNIWEPELVKEILTKNFDFQKPKTNPLVDYLATGLASYEGEKWTKHRKLINPAFHMGKLKQMVPAFYLSCSEMVSKWENMLSTEGSSSCEVDVWPYLQALSSDAISRTAFGSNYEEGRRIFQLQKEQAELVIQAVSSVYIPGWRFVPTKKNNRMKQIDREVQASLRGIINKRTKEMMNKAGGETSSNEDLLGILLESNMRGMQQHDHGSNKKLVGMTIKDVIEECKLFYIAGQETTSVLLVWTMVLLSRHTNWQQQARSEVFQVFGKNKPTFDGLNHLKTVTMIFHEVLRLYPPVVTLGRAIHKETKLGGLSLPAGVLVSLPIILLHYDTEIWGDDATEFNPERFSEGITKATKNQVCYFPFGWGPRICIGQNFAMIEAKMALAMILQRFSFELSPSYAHAPSIIFFLYPQHGAHLILHKL